jgi:hypothetical protein
MDMNSMWKAEMNNPDDHPDEGGHMSSSSAASYASDADLPCKAI